MRSGREGLLTGGEIIIGDKGFAGLQFDQTVASSMPPSSAATVDEKPRLGKLGGIRQWIESINDSLKGRLSLEHHGGHIPQGVWARICQWILALAARVEHSWALWGPD